MALYFPPRHLKNIQLRRPSDQPEFSYRLKYRRFLPTERFPFDRLSGTLVSTLNSSYCPILHSFPRRGPGDRRFNSWSLVTCPLPEAVSADPESTPHHDYISECPTKPPHFVLSIPNTLSKGCRRFVTFCDLEMQVWDLNRVVPCSESRRRCLTCRRYVQRLKKTHITYSVDSEIAYRQMQDSMPRMLGLYVNSEQRKKHDASCQKHREAWGYRFAELGIPTRPRSSLRSRMRRIERKKATKTKQATRKMVRATRTHHPVPKRFSLPDTPFWTQRKEGHLSVVGPSCARTLPDWMLHQDDDLVIVCGFLRSGGLGVWRVSQFPNCSESEEDVWDDCHLSPDFFETTSDADPGEKNVWDVEYVTDSSVVTCGWSGMVRKWDAVTGKLSQVSTCRPSRCLYRLEWTRRSNPSPLCDAFLCCGEDGCVLYDRNLELVSQFREVSRFSRTLRGYDAMLAGPQNELMISQDAKSLLPIAVDLRRPDQPVWSSSRHLKYGCPNFDGSQRNLRRWYLTRIGDEPIFATQCSFAIDFWSLTDGKFLGSVQNGPLVQSRPVWIPTDLRGTGRLLEEERIRFADGLSQDFVVAVGGSSVKVWKGLLASAKQM